MTSQWLGRSSACFRKCALQIPPGLFTDSGDKLNELATTGKCMSEQVEFRVKLHDWHECATQASFIRKVVFVDEQGVSQEEEMDGRDDSCVHALATLGDTAVATGRLRPEGSIGRMAVLKPYRGNGVGGIVLEALVEAARAKGYAQVTLAAQEHA